MSFLEWYRQYNWIFQLVLWGVVIYTYFRNKNKPLDPVTREKAQWYRTVGMAFMVLVIISSCITAILWYDDASGRERIFGLMTIVFWPLFIMISLYLEYHFRRKKKRIDSQLENKEEVL